MSKTLVRFLLLAVGTGVLAAEAEDVVMVREDELNVSVDLQLCEVERAVDLRLVFPVTQLDDDPALTGLTYSAVGWRLDASVDLSRTATIKARPGTLTDGAFTPDGDELVVLEATSGEGAFTWRPEGISKKVYQLVHTARVGSAVDEDGTCVGYLDFTAVDTRATQKDVERAVLGSITHPIVVTQDENLPWQPIDVTEAGTGIATDVDLSSETTTTVFSFGGRGILHYEYALDGGVLLVLVDGVKTATFDEPADWQADSIQFEGYGVHEVSFVYTAEGLGLVAALRGVRWEEDVCSDKASVDMEHVRVDLREGVRIAKHVEDVLPFEYSSTNWIGDVSGASATSVSLVTIVRLTGVDPDVTKWTEEVPGTYRTLLNEPGEGAVSWNPRVGVWKATFDIMNGAESVHHEESMFDIRFKGLMLLVK